MQPTAAQIFFSGSFILLLHLETAKMALSLNKSVAFSTITNHHIMNKCAFIGRELIWCRPIIGRCRLLNGRYRLLVDNRWVNTIIIYYYNNSTIIIVTIEAWKWFEIIYHSNATKTTAADLHVNSWAVGRFPSPLIGNDFLVIIAGITIKNYWCRWQSYYNILTSISHRRIINFCSQQKTSSLHSPSGISISSFN